MNQTIQKINEEDVLFFDLEVVRKNKELNPNSLEFELYQKKTRNRETDQLLTMEEVLENYNKKAALKMCYTKIVAIGVGFIKAGKVHIKALDQGTEEDIIRDFCKVACNFQYVCGINILAYDLPMLVVNGFRHCNMVEILPDKFNTAGKKPWDLKAVIDLMDIFRNTHYANSSLDEICYHFDIPSPKTDLDGSKVSEEYWTNGVERISQYVKQDVLASINVFRKMRFEPIFETFLDKNAQLTKEQFIQDVSLLQKLYHNNYLSNEIKEELQNQLKKKKLTKKDKQHVQHIIESTYLKTQFMASDDKETQEKKKREVQMFLETI